MELTPRQLAAVEASGSVAVTAGAGTGKTAMLAARYLHHIVRDNFSPLEIAAVTFTEKAASELRSRIRAQLLDRAGEDMAAQVDAAQISTIHSLAARICRDFYDSAGIPADFRMLDETDAEILFADRFDDALAKLGPDMSAKLGYTWLRDALRELFTDPPTAQEALEYTDKQYYDVIVRSNELAIAALMRSACWTEAKDVLNRFQGAPGDLLEAYRVTVVNAMSDIAAGKNVSEAVAEILAVKLTGGAQNNWPAGSLERVKECIKSLRASLGDKGEFADIALIYGDVEKEMYTRVCLLRHAFLNVREHLQDAKLDRRVLDFADLEHYSLKVLGSADVQAHYAARWKAILVDEFQDTNPVQEKILIALSKNARLTIVGDGKQSIYGFRRADPRVFKRFRDSIRNDVVLDKTFRAHTGLIEPMNKVFASLLADAHEPLVANREELPHDGPFIEAHSFSEEGCDIDRMRRVEASYIATEIRRIIDSGLTVWDKAAGLRPARPADIAILSRTRAPLDLYIDALLRAGIPAVYTGGGDLLETRTAKDIMALLRFMSDTSDDVALVSLLRGPFFAVSDGALQTLASNNEKEVSWWHLLAINHMGVEHAIEVLTRLLALSRSVTACEIVRIADELTGYTAVISNLEQGERRMADWFGFLALLQKFASLGRSDVVGAERYLRHIMHAETVIARPPLDPGDAVSLMTIHAAKGLEWPIVFVPNLSAPKNQSRTNVCFDAELGVGFKVTMQQPDGSYAKEDPAIRKLVNSKRKKEEKDESARILYVALTRSRDRLYLTSAGKEGNDFAALAPGLDSAGIQIHRYDTSFDQAFADAAVEQKLSRAFVDQLLPVVPVFDVIPVTGLVEYSVCPKRFKYQFVDGHPGIGEGASANARMIGTLVHTALELDKETIEELSPFSDGASEEILNEALRLARVFRYGDDFSSFQLGDFEREIPFHFKLDGAVLSGKADLVGDDFVLDFKTDSEMLPDDHAIQLWAYASALEKPRAYIAYLRQGKLRKYSASELANARELAAAAVNGIVSAHFESTPSDSACRRCSYSVICNDRHSN